MSKKKGVFWSASFSANCGHKLTKRDAGLDGDREGSAVAPIGGKTGGESGIGPPGALESADRVLCGTAGELRGIGGGDCCIAVLASDSTLAATLGTESATLPIKDPLCGALPALQESIRFTIGLTDWEVAKRSVRIIVS